MIIGVDGGGTSTRVLVTDESGHEVASYEAAASAIRPDNVAHSANVITSAVQAALATLPDPPEKARVLCVGVAGAGRPAMREALTDLLTQTGIAEDVIVETDAAIAMHDALGDGAGILLIAGTGSIAFGRGPTGTLARCGGWGPHCGDEGGGYWIGRRALSAVTAAADGREPETALTGAIVTVTEVNAAEDLITWAASADVSQVANLASTVLREASAGDLRANTLLSLAAEELVLHVRTLARQLFGDERAAVTVALTGGLMSRGSPLRARLEQRLKSSVPGAVLHQEDVVPARGAIKLARKTVTSV